MNTARKNCCSVKELRLKSKVFGKILIFKFKVVKIFLKKFLREEIFFIVSSVSISFKK
jgi:hypothetical protein